MVVGTALLILPFAVVSAEAVATVTSIILGALVITLALSADEHGGTLGITGHMAGDRIVALLIAVAALTFAVAGERGLAVVCALAALAEAGLSLVTRYVERTDEPRPTTVTTST